MTVHDPIAMLHHISRLEARDGEHDVFDAPSHPMTGDRIFGGQVLAQAVLATSRTVPADRPVHSMHGYFLRPGSTAQGVSYAVDRIHDGRSFTTRRAQGIQGGVPIFSAIASFQTSAESPELSHAAPAAPAPDGLPSLEARLAPRNETFAAIIAGRPIDTRFVDDEIYSGPLEAPTSRVVVWMRARAPLGDDEVNHRATLAYMSDIAIQEPALRAHGLAWIDRRVRVASLDHALWWHRPVRADEWLLVEIDGESAQGGRSLASARFYDREGAHVASATQEVMFRVVSGDARS